MLRPGGLLVLSCPNKTEYTDKRNVTNEFHVRELYRDELAALLAPRFAHLVWYGQRPGFFSVVWPEQGDARGEIFEATEAAAGTRMPGHARPLYFIVIASATGEAMAGFTPRLSVLADRDEWVYRNYESVTRALSRAAERERAARQAGDAAVESRLVEALTERDALRAMLAASGDAEAERTRACGRARRKAGRDIAAGGLSLVAGAPVSPAAQRAHRNSAMGLGSLSGPNSRSPYSISRMTG